MYDSFRHEVYMEAVENENAVWTKEIEDEFFERIRSKRREREQKLEKLRRDLEEKEGATFKPNVRRRAGIGRGGGEDEGEIMGEVEEGLDDDYDPVAEFEKRMLADLRRRNEIKEKRRHGDPGPHTVGGYSEVVDRKSRSWSRGGVRERRRSASASRFAPSSSRWGRSTSVERPNGRSAAGSEGEEEFGGRGTSRGGRSLSELVYF